MAVNNKVVLISLIVALCAIFSVNSALFDGDGFKFSPRANVSFGNQGPNDFLLYSENAFRNSSAVQQVANVRYTGFNVNVTYIYAMERGINQFANVALVGNLHQSNATVRIASQPGRGFNYTVYFYGRNRS